MPPPLPRCSGWEYSSLRTTHPCHPSPNPLSGRPAHCPFRDLLSVHSRCGLRTRTVTKLVTAIRGLQTFRHLHACPGCFRLERCRVGLAPTGEAPPFHGARGQRTLRAAERTVGVDPIRTLTTAFLRWTSLRRRDDRASERDRGAAWISRPGCVVWGWRNTSRPFATTRSTERCCRG